MNYHIKLITAFVISSFLSFAQENSFGISGGATLSYSPPSNSWDYQPDIGGVINGYYQHYFETIHIKTSIGVEQKAYHLISSFTDELGVAIGNIKDKYEHNYLSLSQQVGIEYGKAIYGFTNLGASAYMYANTIHKRTSNPASLTEMTQSFSIDNSIDVAAMIETGVGYNFHHVNRFYLVAAYTHGFIEQWKSSPLFSEWKNRTVALQVGYQRSF